MPDDIVELPATDVEGEGEELEDEETGPSGRKGPRRPHHLDRKIAAHTELLRKRQGWSLADLAGRVRPTDPDERWTKSRVTQFEKPSRRATVTEIADLCEALDVDLGVFLQDAGVFCLPNSVEGWMQADSRLNKDRRDIAESVYQALISEQAAEDAGRG